MKRIICVLLAMLTMVAFAGCGKKAKRQLYNGKLSKYITLADYKGLKVDTKSDEFKEFLPMYRQTIYTLKRPRAPLQTATPRILTTPAKRTALRLTAAPQRGMTLKSAQIPL